MNNRKNSIVIGLTGQTGAGKSTVAKIFAEQGFNIINADQVARDVVNPGMPCLQELTIQFGSEILNPDHSLNRKALAGIVFTDPEKLKLLNHITHPFIIQAIRELIQDFAAAGEKFILLDAPTLFESKADQFCDRIIAVIASQEIRCARIMQRDHLTRQSALDRMNSQFTEEYFISHSDDVIENHSSPEELAEKSRKLAEMIKSEYD
ncbi:MAG: dephospho-CoA kinase [Oscillospiraceae bacterium]|nr:dephospho-CoA kinase [Oscillospiraceae bacterium]